jgi:uncharacterized membrane protein YphA (DoxX/SURF4 family)
MSTGAEKAMSFPSHYASSGIAETDRTEYAAGRNLTRIWTLLRFTYGLVPIVAGLDKFTNFLTNWESYLNPRVLAILPVSGHAFMSVVGVVEIVAGVLVLLRPRQGAFVVMAWLIGIALSLITGGKFLDVAVRDLVMAIGAFTLGTLTPIAEASRSRE